MQFGGRTYACTLLATAAFALGGCSLIAPTSGDEPPPASTVGPTAESGSVVTSIDGTITVTLPPGWYDHSAEYFDHQAGSSFSAAWMANAEFTTDPEVFATISTSPIGGFTVSLAERHEAFVDDWLDDFDGPDITEGSFVTDDGSQGLWTTLVDKDPQQGISLTAVVIVSDDRAAKIAIQTPADDPTLGRELLDALHTVKLSKVDIDAEAAGGFVDGAYTDGSVAFTVPSQWEAMLTEADARDAALGTEAVYVGMWVTSFASLETASSSFISVAPLTVGAQTPAEAAAELGPVGTVTEDPKGTIEVMSVDEVQPTPSLSGVRMCVRGTPTDTGEAADVCMYELVMADFRVYGSVQARSLDPAAITDFESALATILITAPGE